MSSITKRGNTWQYAVSNYVDGKSRPIRKGGFKTKKEATVAAAELETELSKGFVVSDEQISFYEYFKKWINLYKEGKVTNITMNHYKYSLDVVFAHFSFKPLKEIRREQYQEFLNAIGQKRAKVTVAKINGHIKACTKDAMEEQLIRIDFTRKTELKWTVAAKKSAEKHLSYKESQMLIQGIWGGIDNGLGYSLLLLAITSGMRFGEIVGLTWDDFNFTNNTININKTWGYKSSSPEGFAPTKNEQSNRIIKMDQLTMTHFRKFYEEATSNEFKLVFYSNDTKYKVMSNTNANRLLKKLLDDLGIGAITVHGLRHTHASVLLYKKASIHYVSERLGHGDIETTLKEYTHVLKELRLEDEQITTTVFENIMT